MPIEGSYITEEGFYHKAALNDRNLYGKVLRLTDQYRTYHMQVEQEQSDDDGN